MSIRPCTSRLVLNHQTKIFSMTSDDRLDTYMDVIDVDDKRLAMAKENLAKVDFIGLTEQYDDFLDELAARHRLGHPASSAEERNACRGPRHAGQRGAPAPDRRRQRDRHRVLRVRQGTRGVTKASPADRRLTRRLRGLPAAARLRLAQPITAASSGHRGSKPGLWMLRDLSAAGCRRWGSERSASRPPSRACAIVPCSTAAPRGSARSDTGVERRLDVIDGRSQVRGTTSFSNA